MLLLSLLLPNRVISNAHLIYATYRESRFVYIQDGHQFEICLTHVWLC